MFSSENYSLAQAENLEDHIQPTKCTSSTVKSLLQARVSIRIITVHRDGGGPLLEATSVKKVCVTPIEIGHASVAKSVGRIDKVNGYFLWPLVQL